MGLRGAGHEVAGRTSLHRRPLGTCFIYVVSIAGEENDLCRLEVHMVTGPMRRGLHRDRGRMFGPGHRQRGRATAANRCRPVRWPERPEQPARREHRGALHPNHAGGRAIERGCGGSQGAARHRNHAHRPRGFGFGGRARTERDPFLPSLRHHEGGRRRSRDYCAYSLLRSRQLSGGRISGGWQLPLHDPPADQLS